jgi:ketosteroid isomerase-like protein
VVGAASPTLSGWRVRLALVGVTFRELGLPTSDISAIRAAEKALAEAFESPDPTAWVDFYTDDAVFVGPGAPAIEGRSALLDAAPHISISSMEIAPVSTLGAGDFAATLGSVTWASGAERSDAARVRRRFLMVWRRESDGRWRIAREMLNEGV